MNKSIKFWALYYDVYESLKKGLISINDALNNFKGERKEAAIYFNTYLQNN